VILNFFKTKVLVFLCFLGYYIIFYLSYFDFLSSKVIFDKKV